MQIIFIIQISYFRSGFAIPLTSESPIATTIEPITTQKPIVFSRDSNPFDPLSYSFHSGSNSNLSKPNVTSISANSMAKHLNVLPLAKPSNNARQQRIHVFRPLFVYRQEQEAMRRRAATVRPSHYYPYHSYYPYDPYHYQHQQQQHYDQRYPDYYDSLPHKSFDYISNDLTHPAPDYWYSHQ